MARDPVTIRPAARSDVAELGRLGAALVRAHYRFDDKRFMAPEPDLERGYGWWLSTQLASRDAVVLVAEHGGRLLGYVYAAVEPESWQELRSESGYIHDVIVEEEARGRGIATALMHAAIARLRERGMPRVVLQTADQNTAAQRLFARLGFRRTMVEMTKDLG
jgi:ribosomal protein S18 acetylase RimI-like enzyme